MPFAATWMDLEIIILSEVSQKEKTNAVWYHLVWNLKYNTNEGLPWLRLCTSSAGGTSSIPGWGTKIPHAMGCDQKVIKLNMTQMNLSMKQKQTQQIKKADLWLSKREGSGVGIDWRSGTRRCKLLYIEWINSKVLLYSTESYIQHFMI